MIPEMCVKCVGDKHIGSYPPGVEGAAAQKYDDDVRAILLDGVKAGESAPEIAQRIKLYRKAEYGDWKDFGPTKIYFNDLMMKKQPMVQAAIDASEDKLRTAICYAMTGNYIDFGAVKNVNEEDLEKLLANAPDIALKDDVLEKLKSDLAGGEKLVFVTDNCGEIAMDQLLIREIKKEYPQLKITIMVKGGEVDNDASMMDAEQLRLSEDAKVVTNGTETAGTVWGKISGDACEILSAADVIIAKGQANYETLGESDLPVYFMFLCKCDYFMRTFEVPRYTAIIAHKS